MLWPADRVAATGGAEEHVTCSGSPACGRAFSQQAAGACSSRPRLTGVCFRPPFVVSCISACPAESAHQTHPERRSLSPGDGGTGPGQREHARIVRGEGLQREGVCVGGGVPFQSKQAQRSALKSNLILQFKDSTKLFSGKRREAKILAVKLIPAPPNLINIKPRRDVRLAGLGPESHQERRGTQGWRFKQTRLLIGTEQTPDRSSRFKRAPPESRCSAATRGGVGFEVFDSCGNCSADLRQSARRRLEKTRPTVRPALTEGLG